jgi:hypothetical protein
MLFMAILFLLYLWAELGVGIFFQDSWGLNFFFFPKNRTTKG